MRISDWSSDVCSSDLNRIESIAHHRGNFDQGNGSIPSHATAPSPTVDCLPARPWRRIGFACTVEAGPWRFRGQYRRAAHHLQRFGQQGRRLPAALAHRTIAARRTLELRRAERILARHTFELQTLIRIPY